MDFEHVFDESYERVLQRTVDDKGFFEEFYRRFIASDPRVAALFKSSDLPRQQRMLERSLYRLLVFYASNYADEHLEEIALKHSKLVLNITPDLYDLWLEVLIETVKDFDPIYDENIELSWRLVVSSGITYMKFKYDH